MQLFEPPFFLSTHPSLYFYDFSLVSFTIFTFSDFVFTTLGKGLSSHLARTGSAQSLEVSSSRL